MAGVVHWPTRVVCHLTRLQWKWEHVQRPLQARELVTVALLPSRALTQTCGRGRIVDALFPGRSIVAFSQHAFSEPGGYRINGGLYVGIRVRVCQCVRARLTQLRVLDDSQ